MNIWRKRISYLINELINDEGVYRTAPATSGLLNMFMNMGLISDIAILLSSYSKNPKALTYLRPYGIPPHNRAKLPYWPGVSGLYSANHRILHKFNEGATAGAAGQRQTHRHSNLLTEPVRRPDE